jgi:hypothetical protein
MESVGGVVVAVLKKSTCMGGLAQTLEALWKENRMPGAWGCVWGFLLVCDIKSMFGPQGVSSPMCLQGKKLLATVSTVCADAMAAWGLACTCMHNMVVNTVCVLQRGFDKAL